ncbi:MAG: TRAP transporter large permease subunit [Azospirillum sp.]|nr:TRAP transporter large permease subunit [Azospirillum sp.]
MILQGSLLLLGGLFALLVLGTPVAVALGLSGAAVIGLAQLGIMALPTNTYTGIAKYPLIALPMFVLAGLIFERAGVALRLVRFASALVGPRRGGLGVVAILVCMILGGISGSGPADAAAVAMVMIPGMVRQGYPRAFAASVIAAAGSTAILIPPSIAFIVYSVLVPSASVPALFAAGLLPGLLAGAALIVPTLVLARRHGFGGAPDGEQPGVWQSFREASWGLLAPVIILGGLRSGLFTPTEAAVVVVVYGLAVGGLVYRTLTWAVLYRVLVESAEISAIVMLIIATATVFAHAGSTLGSFDIFAQGLIGLTGNETVMLLVLNVILLVAGMLLDAISIFLIFMPILTPVMQTFGWDPVWFGVIMTLNLAIGQFTPPLAVNLMVTARIGRTTIEATLPWILWMMAAMLAVLLLLTFCPGLVIGLPRLLGYR